MTTLLLSDDHNFVRCCHSNRRIRLVARLRASNLDAALATGASPDSSAPLSLHAHSLISAKNRRKLSEEILQILHRAEQPRSVFDPTVPICRSKVLDVRELFEALADRLQDRNPVTPDGVANVRRLLREGAGPLYERPSADDLKSFLEDAIVAPQPRL
jgi:hypothetical protein